MYTFLICLQAFAMILLLGEMIYITVQRPARMQITLMIFVVSTLITLIGYQMQILAQTEEAARYGVDIAYVGKPFAIMSSVIFILEYCGYELKPIHYILWSVESSIFPIAMFTNRMHYLFYSSVTFNRAAHMYSPLEVTHGPIYYLYMANCIIDFSVSLFFVIREIYRKRSKNFLAQNIFLAGALISTMTGYALYLLGVTNGYDSTMLGAICTALIISVLFLKYRIFDAVSLAKDQALYGSSSGLIVIDEAGKTEYTNALTDRLIKEGVNISELEALPDGDSRFDKNGRIYSVTKNVIVDKGRCFGKAVELTDITDSHNYASRLQKEVESRTRDILNIQRSVITSFAGIVEARDHSTGEHINRIKYYVRIIAEQLRDDNSFPGIINDDFIEILTDVAPLHDIGKLGVPDSILKKRGSLTPDEFEVIKKHTVRGSQIITECLGGVESPEYVEMAMQTALYHHEKFNGTGYPFQLHGNKIPLSARILAVADVYDAVRSERQYKPPMSVTEASKIIEDGSGTHFDPVIVDAFMKALPKIEQM